MVDKKPLELISVSDWDAVETGYDESHFHAEGDEDSTEYEASDAADAGGVPEAAMPKFRQLVKAKKAEFKNKYGKANLLKRKRGWRYYWKQWRKAAGGLKALKQQAMSSGSIDQAPAMPAEVPADNSMKDAMSDTPELGAGDGKAGPSSFPSWAKWGLIGLGALLIVGTGAFFLLDRRDK